MNRISVIVSDNPGDAFVPCHNNPLAKRWSPTNNTKLHAYQLAEWGFSPGLAHHMKYIYHEVTTTAEACPDCGDEVEIKTNGRSTCPECGHKNMLPCSQCKLLEKGECDWTERGCTPFPNRTRKPWHWCLGHDPRQGRRI